MKPLHFYVFAEDDLHDSFQNAVSDLLCSTICPCCVFLYLFFKQVNMFSYCLALLLMLSLSSTLGPEQSRVGLVSPSTPSHFPVRMGRSGRSFSNLVPLSGSSCQWVYNHPPMHVCNIFKWLLFENVFLLFLLQLILREVDSLLYVDTDIIFLQPVEEIWALLSLFNSSQLAAMAPEHEEPRIGWYNRFARHPYYGKTGINSGVMLMNLTRLREKLFKVFFFSLSPP